MSSGKKPPPEGVGPPPSMRTPKTRPNEGGERADVGKRAPKKQPQANSPVGSAVPTTRKAWTGAEASRALFAKTEQVKAMRPVYPDEVEYAEAYERCRKKYNVFPPGRQRAPTAEEFHDDFLWRTGAIHLDALPGHFKQTKTLKQRVRALAHMRSRAYSVLYLPPPPGFKLRQHGARFQLNVTLLGMNENGEVTDPVALELLAHVNSIHITPTSIEFWFVRPEDSAKFAGRTLRLPGGTVTLLATESFTTEDPDHGFDDVAMHLLYEIKLIGGSRLDPEDILAISEHICGGMEIVELDVGSCATSSELAVLQETCWTITLSTMNGPPGLVNVRELAVKLGDRDLLFGVHQPRLAKFPPCPVCLHDWHTRQKCPHKEATPEAASRREQLRAPRRLLIEVPEPTKFPRPPKPATPAIYAEQLDREYILLEPEAARAQASVAKLAEEATAALLEATRAQAKLEATEREAREAAVAREVAAQACSGKTSPTNQQAVSAKAEMKTPDQKDKEELLSKIKTPEAKATKTKTKIKASPTAKLQSAEERVTTPKTIAAKELPVAKLTHGGEAAKAATEKHVTVETSGRAPAAEQQTRNTDTKVTEGNDKPPEGAEHDRTNPTVKEGRAEAPGLPAGDVQAAGDRPSGSPFDPIPPSHPKRLAKVKAKKDTTRARIKAAKTMAMARVAAEQFTAGIKKGKAQRDNGREAQVLDVIMDTDEAADAADDDCQADEVRTHPLGTSTVDQPNTTPVGEKRGRVDTVDDPSAIRLTEKPPTRQARANTAQASVHAPTAVSLQRAKQRAAKQKKGAETRQRQLSVARFLQPQGAPADEGMEVDDEENPEENLATTKRDLTEEEWRTLSFDGIKQRLGLREITTPADGHCLYSAIHAAKASSCPDELIRTKAVVKEIRWWRRELAARLGNRFEGLIQNGSVNLRDASMTFLGKAETDETTMPLLLAHFEEDAAISCDHPVGRKYWGTSYHIVALVDWDKEPVYVFSVLGAATRDREWEAVVQRYYLNEDTGAVCVETLSIGETVAQLHVYAAKKVLPLILVLHHCNDQEGLNTSHFQALRVPEQHYMTWSGSRQRSKAMAKRLEEALRLIRDGTLNPVAGHQLMPSPCPDKPKTSSEFEPSIPLSAAPSTEPAKINSKAPAGPRTIDLVSPESRSEERAPTVQGGEKQEAGFGPPTPAVGMAVSLALEASPSIVFNSALSQLNALPSTGLSATPLDADQLGLLMERLQTSETVEPDEQISRLLMQANAANRLAFANWKRGQQGPTRELHKDLDSLDEAIRVYKTDGLRLAQVVRALPYPQVYLAIQADTKVIRLGRAFARIGMVQMLSRLATDARLSADATVFCTEWAVAIDAAPEIQATRLAQQEDRWARLKHLLPRNGPRLPLDPAYMGRFVAADDWHRLLAFAVLLPEHLGKQFRSASVPVLCDALSMWLLTQASLDYTAAAATMLRHREWAVMEALLLGSDGADGGPATTQPVGAAVKPPQGDQAGAPDRS